VRRLQKRSKKGKIPSPQKKESRCSPPEGRVRRGHNGTIQRGRGSCILASGGKKKRRRMIKIEREGKERNKKEYQRIPAEVKVLALKGVRSLLPPGEEWEGFLSSSVSRKKGRFSRRTALFPLMGRRRKEETPLRLQRKGGSSSSI